MTLITKTATKSSKITPNNKTATTANSATDLHRYRRLE
jgi:hypothetical protein